MKNSIKRQKNKSNSKKTNRPPSKPPSMALEVSSAPKPWPAKKTRESKPSSNTIKVQTMINQETSSPAKKNYKISNKNLAKMKWREKNHRKPKKRKTQTNSRKKTQTNSRKNIQTNSRKKSKGNSRKKSKGNSRKKSKGKSKRKSKYQPT